MLAVKLICVGKMKEKHYIEAVEEYAKRLSGYCRFQIEELPEQRLSDAPSAKEIDACRFVKHIGQRTQGEKANEEVSWVSC